MRKFLLVTMAAVLLLAGTSFLLSAIPSIGQKACFISEVHAEEHGAEEAVEEMTGPITWAHGAKAIWAALAIGITAICTAWAQSKIGVAGAGAMAEKPEVAGIFVALIAIPETMVILGFVIAAMIVMG